MFFIDTETIGFYGIPVTMQIAYKDDPAYIVNIWEQTSDYIINLINNVMSEGVIYFNACFDHFMLCKLYSICIQIPNTNLATLSSERVAKLELSGRFLGCLKPSKVIDLMLVAKKNNLQSLMEREDIRIRAVPGGIAEELADILIKSIPLDDIYFEKYKKKGVRWLVYPNRNVKGYKDIVLKFRPSFGLKAICKHLKISREGRKTFDDITPSEMPKEKGYMPWGFWTELFEDHKKFWAENELARQYAKDDASDTRALWNAFGKPEFNDNDSVMACAVAATRLRGFAVNKEALGEVIEQAKKEISTLGCPVNVQAPREVFSYIGEKCSPVEKNIMMDGNAIVTDGKLLKKIARWKEGVLCTTCEGIDPECKKCNGDGFIEGEEAHPAALRAGQVLKVRKHLKLIEILSKIHEAGRVHPDFSVIGALSGRMSGAGGVNYQGIPSKKHIRQCFTLAEEGEILCGGDFSGFEVTIACAKYNDTKLIEDTNGPYKIHAFFGADLYNKPIEEVMANEELYKKAKIGLFSLFYGAQPFSISTQTDVPLERAERAYKGFFKRYTEFSRVVKGLEDVYNPIHGKEWVDPLNYAESMFGFKRYYDLEIKIMKGLFDISNDLPSHWLSSNETVNRGKYDQKLPAAIKSALRGCIHSIKNGIVRTAMNHGIQASGAEITKGLQCKFWELQPSGFHPWVIRQFQVHDEIVVVCKPEVGKLLNKIVDNYIEEKRKVVPLLGMEFKVGIKTWADLK